MTQLPPQQPSPPSASHSLAAAAALNSSANIPHSPIDRARRRSSLRMNLSLNDPTLPGPGELQMSPSMRSHNPPWPASPSHQRAPSLGELHQELENEQEAQVNRLLQMIRQQQQQIQALSASAPTTANPNSSTAIDDSTPTSERSLSLPRSATASQQNIPSIAAPRARSPMAQPHNMSRTSSYASRGSSRTGSPSIRPMSGQQRESDDFFLGGPGSRDESAFYQAETQMLTRENQMLKLRIRELERQLGELNPTSPITHTPVTASNLATSPPLAARNQARTPPASGAASTSGDVDMDR